MRSRQLSVGERMTMFLLPFVVLGLSRLGAEVFVRLLPMHIVWIPSLLVYYAAIEGAVLPSHFVVDVFNLSVAMFLGVQLRTI